MWGPGGEVSLFDPLSHPENWLPKVVCMSMEIHGSNAGVPEGWKGSRFVPLMHEQGFVDKGTYGELVVWCHTERLKAYQG